MATLFVSDLHLPPQPSPLRDAFQRFLQGPARQADALYLLGDVFESWVGDDLGMQDYAPEVAQLAALTAGGVPVYFQAGNRDFMVGADFALLTGAKILADPVVVDLHGTPTLVSHGDLFCTGDAAYQRWRRFSRNGVAQALFRLMPRAWRRGFAERARTRSAVHKAGQMPSIMDASDGAVNAAFARHGVARMIHGHTHRPANHRHDVGGETRERIVLADWRGESGEVLSVDSRGMLRIPLR